jgi:hypothetical protein
MKTRSKSGECIFMPEDTITGLCVGVRDFQCILGVAQLILTLQEMLSATTPRILEEFRRFLAHFQMRDGPGGAIEIPQMVCIGKRQPYDLVWKFYARNKNTEEVGSIGFAAKVANKSLQPTAQSAVRFARSTLGSG